METEAAVTARGLRLRLGRTPVLQGIDLRVEVGEVYGLLGRNGAGKTTTLRCLLGFLRPDAGESTVLGVPSSRLHRLPPVLGIALDPPGLDPSLTVEQNLRLSALRGGLRQGRSVDEVLRLVGLEHRRHHRADRLSHGQERRVAVARALLGEPRLLILDEPLSGLDPEGVESLLELLRRLAREEGRTVVFSSHHLREVEEVCDRVGLLEGGRVLLEDRLETLLGGAAAGLYIRCRSPETARRVLLSSPAVRGFEAGEGGFEVQLEEKADRAALLADLVGAGAEVEAFEPHRVTLVDVFRKTLAS